jgi:hypothetical protein
MPTLPNTTNRTRRKPRYLKTERRRVTRGYSMTRDTLARIEAIAAADGRSVSATLERLALARIEARDAALVGSG